MNVLGPCSGGASRALALLALAGATLVTAAVDRVRDSGPVDFGASELEAALRGGAPPPRLVLRVAGGGAPESFRVRVGGDGAARKFRIDGTDLAGAMYRAQEAAETLRLAGPAAVRDLDRAPHLRVRGMKFNAPLDARTPSHEAPTDGQHALEFRYAIRRGLVPASDLIVNVTLRRGPNRIDLRPGAAVNPDHLVILP